MTADEDTLLSGGLGRSDSLAGSAEAAGATALDPPKKEKLGCGAGLG